MKTIGQVAREIKSQAPSYTIGSGRINLPSIFGGNSTEKNMASMGELGTLFAIVNKTSNATAGVEWNLWARPTNYSGAKEDRTLVRRHLALELWNKPNPFYTQHDFVETFQQHIDLTGEGWWIIDRDPNFRSIPLGLWCVRPDRMTPVPHPTNFLSGYIYTGPNGEKIPFELDEVIQMKMPNPLDPYRGLGPVQAVMVDIDSAKYSAQWNRQFFLNGAEPGGIIEVPQKLDDDEFNEMVERWREQHQGVAKAHRVAILENAKWVNTKFSQKDMEFNALRDSSREIIREAFGFPKFMLGLVDDVNRANAEASEYMFDKHLTVPRADRIKDTLNSKYLPLFGDTATNLEFDYVSPVTGNSDEENNERNSRTSSAKTLIDAGFDPAETLKAMGLPDIKYIGTQAVAGS